MRVNRNDRGITIVALVITIIVLLILASIVIGTLSGDNSIIRRTQEAANNYEQSSQSAQEAANEYANQLGESYIGTTEADKKIVTITYDANGGQGGVKSQTEAVGIDEEASISLSNNIPTRDGYTFLGWAESKDATEISYTVGETYNFNESTTIYAVWKAEKIQLIVNPNGGTWRGSTATSTITGEVGNTERIENPVAPNGHTVTFVGNGGNTPNSQTNTITFRGWNLQGEGTLDGTIYEFGEGSGTLTAQYNVGSITLPNTTRIGATFNGWYDQETGGNRIGGIGDSYTPTDNITLYAQWAIDNYELTVNPNGGTWNGNEASSTLNGDYGTTIDIPNPEPPAGYTVNFNTDGGSNIESITTTNTFTNWTQTGEGSLTGNRYTYGLGNGTLTANYDYGTIILPTTDKEGHEIDGWYNEEGELVGKPGEEYIPEKDETLTLHWTTNRYTVVLDGNGATSGGMSNIEMTYGQSATLPINEYQRDGYEFIGWSSDKDATSPEYEDQATINNLTTENGETVTLYALWKKTITITYDANGGSGAPATQTATLYNSQLSANIQISNTIPANEGYTFNGWTDIQGSSEVKYVAGGTYGFSDSAILYAVWGVNDYTLTVNPNGGTWRDTTENTPVEGYYGQTINIEDPEPPAGYEVTFNIGEGQTTTLTANRKFVEWAEEGPGSLNNSQYTFGAGSGALTARYETEKIKLPDPDRNGYHI